MVERIVSLAPSATTIVSALDGDDRLLAGTVHDDAATDVGGWVTPDLDAVVAHDPDLVLTTDALQRSIADDLRDRGRSVRHFEPQTLAEVPGYIEAVGAAIGEERAARGLAQEFDDRLARVRKRVDGRERPTVYCEEWSDPPMVGGNWIPEAVGVAGGRYPFCDPGERSRRIDGDEVEAAAPEVAILHICGQGTAVDPARLDDRGWEIPAIRHTAVYVIDDALLNQPSQRLARGIEKLADLIHPPEANDA